MTMIPAFDNAPLERYATRSLHWYTVVAASIAALGLLSYLSLSNGLTASSFTTNDVQLSMISEQAERLQDYERHIRKASLSSPSEPMIPFAGFVGGTSRIVPGGKLELSDPGSAPHFIEIVSAHKVARSGALMVNSRMKFDLVLVTGRVEGVVDGPLVTVLVAVTPQGEHRTLDQRSL